VGLKESLFGFFFFSWNLLFNLSSFDSLGFRVQSLDIFW
jgi:hypothetical protein